MNKVAIFVLITVVSGQWWKNEVCEVDGQEGECVRLKDCPRALKSLLKGSRPKYCGLQGIRVIVCCQKDGESGEVGLRARDACKSHQNRAFYGDYTKIVGGRNAVKRDFSHMAALGYGPKNQKSWKCGGSLISERFILTAAHCMSSNLGEIRYIRMGDIYLDGSSETSKDYEVLRRIPHPNYKAPSTYHDIALLELKTNVSFNMDIKPACLRTESFIPKRLKATGWGLTELAGSLSNILQEVSLQLFSLEECNLVYRSEPGILEQGISGKLQICAGGRNEEKDTCQGDSGGPLQFGTPSKPYTIVGVTSFGRSCGQTNVPGVYTRVSNYIKWIENIVWP